MRVIFSANYVRKSYDFIIRALHSYQLVSEFNPRCPIGSYFPAATKSHEIYHHTTIFNVDRSDTLLLNTFDVGRSEDPVPTLSDLADLCEQTGSVPAYYAVCNGGDISFINHTQENITPDLYIDRKRTRIKDKRVASANQHKAFT